VAAGLNAGPVRMVTMKRSVLVSMVLVFVASLAVSLASAQDSALGDYARQVRKQKGHQAPSAKKFDNDNIPMSDKLSVVGQEPAADPNGTDATNNKVAPPPDAAGTSTAQVNGNQDKAAADDEVAQKKQMFEGWKKKIDGQRGQCDLLARELDVLNREYRLRAAAFYADAGNRLRNSGTWDKEDSQFKDQITAKQKQLDDAKAQLDDLQEQARKAGVPSSMRD
jgi:hypothetical protein